MLEDRMLVWKIKAGSNDALRRIYEKYKKDMLSLANALLHNVGAAEDVVHDVFVSFVQSADKFKLTGSLRGYLLTCVANLCRDKVRAKKREPKKLNDADIFAQLKKWSPDVIVVAAYGKILRQNVLDLPKFGCVNVHASLLPRWRGASPIQAVILHGDEKSGVSIMLMSLTPDSDICSVLGIGVAVSVSVSTFLLNFLNLSLWITPNFCSSSTTRSPSDLNETSSWRSRWVPITTSTSPLPTPEITFSCSGTERKRDSIRTLTGNWASRPENVS